MFVPSVGLPCHPIIKILGTSTLAGAIVWLGKRIIPLNFQYGFLFSTISLISIKIAHMVDQAIKAKFQAPRNFIFGVIAFGLPIAIMHQITPLNLLEASYLTIVAIGTRRIFRILTDRNPFL